MSEKQGVSRKLVGTRENLFSQESPMPISDALEEDNPWGDGSTQKDHEEIPPVPPSASSDQYEYQPQSQQSEVRPEQRRPQRQQNQPQYPDLTSNDVEPDVQPPIYSAPTSSQPQGSSSNQRSRTNYTLMPGLPPVPLFSYAPPGSNLSRDGSIIQISNPDWGRSLDLLTSVIYEQISLPPRPDIRIVGNHLHGGRGFDFRLNMMRYFLPREGEGGLSYVKPRTLPVDRRKSTMGKAGADGSANTPAGLQETLQAFWADPARPKSFTVTRMTANWDTDFIVGRVHALTASLNSEHRIRVTFPLGYNTFTVTISEDSAPKSFVSGLFAVFKQPKEYGVEVVWPYATAGRSDAEDDGGNQPGGGARVKRKCLLRTEEGWWSDWREVVREAVRTNRQGWVGLDDWMDMAMRPTAT